MNPSYTLRALRPERDFERIAALLSSFETEPTTPTGLGEWIDRQTGRQFRIMAAVDEQDRTAGFICLYPNGDPADRYFGLYVVVAPEQRRRGLGAQLYDDLLPTAKAWSARQLSVNLRDDDESSYRFAEQRGFVQFSHNIEMALDLGSFDDRPFDPILESLKAEGFVFTSMAELGNSEQAQRKLFALNNSAAASTPGTDGRPPWGSFEDFQQKVCQSDWYRVEGQFVAIERQTGVWAAMSAITRFEGADHAYNLFTGVDQAFRGRKLAQAVKTLALRYARQTLGVGLVRTSHNAKNAPMIAIDRKFGYFQTPGTYNMVKSLD
jgi:L-amino acid N-acyltransferase YncA